MAFFKGSFKKKAAKLDRILELYLCSRILAVKKDTMTVFRALLIALCFVNVFCQNARLSGLQNLGMSELSVLLEKASELMVVKATLLSQRISGLSSNSHLRDNLFSSTGPSSVNDLLNVEQEDDPSSFE